MLRQVRAILITVGPPLLVRALGVGTAVLIVASVLFAPSGMSARDLVREMHGSVGARAAIWLGWVLVASPASSIVFDAPGTRVLRSLRLGRWSLLCALCSLLCVVQLPWAVLFARGAGSLEMVGAIMLAIAIGSAATAALARPAYWGLAAVALLAALGDIGPQGSAVVGVLLAPHAVLAAWRVALEDRGGAWHIVRPTNSALALYATHVVRLARAARARLLMGGAAASVGVGALVLSIRNSPTDEPVSRALAVMTFPLFAAASVCVAPILECESQLRPLLRSLRIRQSVVLLAFLAAVATPTTAFAASAGLVTCVVSAAMPTLSVAALVAWGLVGACVVGLWGRRHQRMKRPSGGAFAAGVIALSILATVLAWSW